MIIFEVGKALCKFKNCNQMGKSSHPFLSIGGNTVELWAEEVKHNAIDNAVQEFIRLTLTKIGWS